MFGRQSIFISHSSEDDALAGRLLAGLKKRRIRAFTDHDEKQGLVPGEAWLAALGRQLRRADAVLILVSDSWRRSEWCQAEYKTAKLLGKPVIPVVLGPDSHDDIEPDLQKTVVASDGHPSNSQIDAIARATPPRRGATLTAIATAALLLGGFLAGLERPTYGRWDLQEYRGGAYYDLQLDPADPDTVFALNTGFLGDPGIFASENCGETWFEVPTPEDAGGEFNRFHVTDSELLLSTDNHLWSLDRRQPLEAASWQHIEIGGLSSEVLVAKTPADRPDQLVFGTLRPGGTSFGAGTASTGSSGDLAFAASSETGGTGFIDRSTGEARGFRFQMNDLAFHPEDPDKVVIAAADDGVFYSFERLRTVHPVRDYPGRKPLTVVFSRNGQMVFIGDRDGLFGFPFPGDSDAIPDIRAINTDIGEARFVTPMSDGAVYVGSTSGSYFAKSWSGSFEPLAPSLPIRHVNQVLPCGDALLFATGGGGVFRQREGSSQVKFVLGHSSFDAFVGGGGEGFELTSTPLFLWRRLAGGDPQPILETNYNATVLAVLSELGEPDATSARNPVALASRSYADSVILAGLGDGRIFRKALGETTWSTTYVGPSVVNALAISPINHDLILATFRGGAPQISRDAGLTWKALGIAEAAPENAMMMSFAAPDGRFLLVQYDGIVSLFDPADETVEPVVDSPQSPFTGGTEIKGSLLLIAPNGSTAWFDPARDVLVDSGRLPLSKETEWINLHCCDGEGMLYASAGPAGLWRTKVPKDDGSFEWSQLFTGTAPDDTRIRAAAAADGRDLPRVFTSLGELHPSSETRLCFSDEICWAWGIDRMKRRLRILLE